MRFTAPAQSSIKSFIGDDGGYMQKRATIFLDDGNCQAAVMLNDNPAENFWKFGITELNILDLVDVVAKQGYQVTLYRLGSPTFFAPK